MIELEPKVTARAPLIELENVSQSQALALSPEMEGLARGYIDARKRAGMAWLSMGRFLTEARQAAKHGEWGLFLQATNTSQDTADRLMAIYTQSLDDPAFANAVRNNVLSVSAAYELTTAPPDVQQRVLSSEAPITRQQIREEKRAANSAPARSLGTQAATEIAQPDLPPEFAVIQRRFESHQHVLSPTWDGVTRRYVVRKEGGTGAVMLWPDVLSKLERIEDQEEYDAEHPEQVAMRPVATPPPTYPLPAKMYAMALADLEATLPDDLRAAGYAWQSGMPPILTHISGWRGEAPIPDLALSLAYDREKAKAKADQRLPAPIYVKVMDLIGKLSAAVVGAEHAHAAKLARAIAILIEQETAKAMEAPHLPSPIS